MTSEEALNLIVKLAGFRLLVRANRFGCDSDLARLAHDNVVDVLRVVSERLSNHIDQICDVFRETDPGEREELLYHLEQCDRALERDWFDICPVGGWQPTSEDGSFTNPVTGQADIAVSRAPVAIAVNPDRLCRLPDILEEIADECAIRFDMEIVFYRPWHPAQSPDLIAAADPADEIPW